MSERISIKGKGDELFFGADQPGGSPKDAEMRATQFADNPASQPAPLPASSPATMPPSAQQEEQQPDVPGDADGTEAMRRLHGLLMEEHSLHYSYRFTRSEIDFIRDAVYELEVKHELPATRNDIVRVGLNWLMEDYRLRRKESVLVRVLRAGSWKASR